MFGCGCYDALKNNHCECVVFTNDKKKAENINISNFKQQQICIMRSNIANTATPVIVYFTHCLCFSLENFCYARYFFSRF